MAQFARLGKRELRCHIDDMADISPSSSAAVPVPADPTSTPPARESPAARVPREIGGPKGPEPTRYGDWEVNGRCSDF
jgi:hypothetical protein